MNVNVNKEQKSANGTRRSLIKFMNTGLHGSKEICCSQKPSTHRFPFFYRRTKTEVTKKAAQKSCKFDPTKVKCAPAKPKRNEKENKSCKTPFENRIRRILKIEKEMLKENETKKNHQCFKHAQTVLLLCTACTY